MNKDAVKILTENGASYTDAPVVADGIITASGPSAAGEFGKKLAEMLS